MPRDAPPNGGASPEPVREYTATGAGIGERPTRSPTSTRVLTELGEQRDTPAGTPRGGIRSPLLADIALSPLDEHLHREWKSGRAECQHRDQIAKALNPVYTAPTGAAAEQRFLEFAETRGEKYPAIVGVAVDGDGVADVRPGQSEGSGRAIGWADSPIG